MWVWLPIGGDANAQEAARGGCSGRLPEEAARGGGSRRVSDCNARPDSWLVLRYVLYISAVALQHPMGPVTYIVHTCSTMSADAHEKLWPQRYRDDRDGDRVGVVYMANARRRLLCLVPGSDVHLRYRLQGPLGPLSRFSAVLIEIQAGDTSSRVSIEPNTYISELALRHFSAWASISTVIARPKCGCVAGYRGPGNSHHDGHRVSTAARNACSRTVYSEAS